MAVLSKTVIEHIARKMTEKSKKHSDALMCEYKDIVCAVVDAQIPDEVKTCFESNSDYIETATEAYLDGNGFNREYVRLGKQFPSPRSNSFPVKLTSVIADRIMKSKRKYEKAKEEYEQLYKETEAALTALKTHKSIKENLPEAVPFLPPPMSNSLVVNFESLQQKLKKQSLLKEVH